jgi:sugar phosphate isomerase/epimerase
MAPKITVQLYSVRDYADKSYADTISQIADIGFKNVEPAGYAGLTTKEASKILKEYGIKAPSCHGPLPVGDNKNKILDDFLTMEHKYVFTGCPPNFNKNFTTIDGIKKTAELYCEAAEFLKPHGIQIGYHNHDWDLIDIEGIPAYKTFLDNTPDSILYEADLFWVACAGIDEVSFVKEIGTRAKILHFKDGIFKQYQTQKGEFAPADCITFLPAGSGNINLKGVAEIYNQTEYVAVEIDSFDGDMMQAIKDSYTWLIKNNIAI